MHTIFNDAQPLNDSLTKSLDELRAEVNNEVFLLKCKLHIPFAIYGSYLKILENRAPITDTLWERIWAKIHEFTNLVAPGVPFDQDLTKYILHLKSKAYSQRSGSRENDLREEIKQLKKEKEVLEKQVQVHLRAVSDMSYRHLTEMLPIASRAAAKQPSKPKPQSGPDWQNFWNQIWTAAATKTDSPLHALYINSNNRRRAQIQAAGHELFGTLSANMHDFGQAYDPVKYLRDVVPGSILDALTPQNFTADGDVMWDVEVTRFLP